MFFFFFFFYKWNRTRYARGCACVELFPVLRTAVSFFFPPSLKCFFSMLFRR